MSRSEMTCVEGHCALPCQTPWPSSLLLHFSCPPSLGPVAAACLLRCLGFFCLDSAPSLWFTKVKQPGALADGNCTAGLRKLDCGRGVGAGVGYEENDNRDGQTDQSGVEIPVPRGDRHESTPFESSFISNL